MSNYDLLLAYTEFFLLHDSFRDYNHRFLCSSYFGFTNLKKLIINFILLLAEKLSSFSTLDFRFKLPDKFVLFSLKKIVLFYWYRKCIAILVFQYDAFECELLTRPVFSLAFLVSSVVVRLGPVFHQHIVCTFFERFIKILAKLRCWKNQHPVYGINPVKGSPFFGVEKLVD